MDNIELRKILEDIGFTKGESGVYLTLLKIGESKVGPVITSSKISRSKVYDILERLIQKGVVSKIQKNGILFYQALPPQRLINYLKEKEEEIKNEAELLQKALPQLSSLLPNKSIDIKIYQGVEGFKAVIERTIEDLTETDTYKAMGISETNEFMRNYASKIYLVQKVKRFKARSIFDEKGAYKIKERKTKYHEVRVLPKGWHTPALFTIYQDVVGIHLGNNETTMSIVIKSRDIAESFDATFEAMWKLAKK